MLVGGQLVDIMELICGDQYTMQKAETASRTGWTTDPVHPSRHTVAKIGLHLIEKMGNYSPVGSGGGNGGQRSAAPAIPRSDNRANSKRRRDESCEDERVPNRPSRSEIWKERGRGSGRMRGGDGPRGGGGGGHRGRGGHNTDNRVSYNSYGDRNSGYQVYQREGSSSRGANRGGGGGYRGRQFRSGYDRWDIPY